MKICPNCRIDCENPAEVCKNCNYSFIECKVINNVKEENAVYKICPNCNSEVEEYFEICWNCNFSFIENKVIEIADTDSTLPVKICPNCQVEVEENFEICWNCNFSFEEAKIADIKDTDDGEQDIDCLRCKIALRYAGKYNFHEGPRMGVLGNFFELMVNKESFDLYVCPKCGKVEFFVA